ncbi:MAG: AMP-binding protein [Microthrixaceae bacterium]
MLSGPVTRLVKAQVARVGLLRHDLTLGSLLQRAAAVHGDAVMVDQAAEGRTGVPARVWTVAEAAALVDRWAAALVADGTCPPGGRVVLAMPNSTEQFLATLAVSRAGGIPAPVNDAMRAEEVAHVVLDADAALVIRELDELDAMADRAGIDEGLGEDRGADVRVAALFYTSGTTGVPKGAALTHRGLVGELGRLAAAPANLVISELLVALPVAHIYGFAALAAAGIAGVPVRFRPRFRPDECLNDLTERGSGAFAGVPAMYRMLEEAGADDADLSSVRVWISGADVMPPELAQRFKRRGAALVLPGVGAVGEATFAEGYGMVETGGGAAAKLSPPFVPLGLGEQVGVPLPGYSFKVLDHDGSEVRLGAIGQLYLRGPGVLEEYWGDADATAAVLDADGWLATGDLVRKGPLGTFTFQGRAKALIKSGGFSVYPLEVETVLETHPDVLEAGVVGLPDEHLGEIPVAAVRLAQGSQLSADELCTWAAAHLSEYKAPRRVVLVDDLPRTGTNKLQRDELAARLQRLQ